MRNLKTVILLLLANLLASSLPSFSQRVSKEVAMDKALSFMQQLESPETAGSRSRQTVLNKKPRLFLASDFEELFIFNDDANGGYYIVSGDERMPDILGYSIRGRFDAANIPNNLKSLLNEYAEQVKYLWIHPEIKARSPKQITGNAIDAMLDCKWGQGEPYNGMCPSINGVNAYTGCLATAMAQIMYYHRWPEQTTDVIPGYTTVSFGVEVQDIPVTTINWDQMLDEYTKGGYSAEQAEAVATLMKLCGAAVGMDYCDFVSSTSADYQENAMTRYFGYDECLVRVSRNAFEPDEWEQIIYDELSGGRPVLYSSFNDFSYIGHAFVIDGYDGNGYFHANLGWGNLSYSEITEGYYLLTDVEGFNMAQSALVGIQKPQPDSKKAYGIMDDSGKMTLYFDTEKENRKGTVYNNVRSLSEISEMKECVIDPSFSDFPLGTLYAYFFNCKNLKKVTGLKFLNTAHVADMSGLFSRCESLESIDLEGFYTGKVTNMSDMFYHCSSLKSLDLSSLNTENVEWMSEMFMRCFSLEDINLSNLNTSKVLSMYCMFEECTSLNNLDLSSFDTHSVIDMGLMFRYCESLESLDVSNFNTENVNSMGNMFDRCLILTSLNLSHFNTQNVEHFGSMFRECISLKQLDLSNFDTSKATTMVEMFQYCEALEELNVSSFNTSNVTSMSYMFQCGSLKRLDLSNFDTQNVTDMMEMFGGCGSLTSLDISNFNTKNVTNMERMFMGMDHAVRIFVGDDWSVEKVENGEGMFLYDDCLVGGMGTKYDENHVGKEYAHLDGGSANPGYLSKFVLVDGDANGDGTVNAADIVEVVNYIMGSMSEIFKEKAADVNNDTFFNIADIIHIVNQILSKE